MRVLLWSGTNFTASAIRDLEFLEERKTMGTFCQANATYISVGLINVGRRIVISIL